MNVVNNPLVGDVVLVLLLLVPTTGPGQFLPSDLTPVLLYGSGSSSDFLPKILGVNTTLFLCNTQFYFTLSSVLLCKSHKTVILKLSVTDQLVACPPMVWITQVKFPIRFFKSPCL
jgi:hypothetical protein